MRHILSILIAVCLFANAGVAQTKPLDINKASAKEIAATLEGIGPKKAEAIVAYRKKHGALKSTDDLLKVPGLGPATVKKNLKALGLKRGKASLDVKAVNAGAKRKATAAKKSAVDASKKASSAGVKATKRTKAVPSKKPVSSKKTVRGKATDSAKKAKKGSVRIQGKLPSKGRAKGKSSKPARKSGKSKTSKPVKKN